MMGVNYMSLIIFERYYTLYFIVILICGTIYFLNVWFGTCIPCYCCAAYSESIIYRISILMADIIKPMDY